jgi:hypothetical protein
MYAEFRRGYAVPEQVPKEVMSSQKVLWKIKAEAAMVGLSGLIPA